MPPRLPRHRTERGGRQAGGGPPPRVGSLFKYALRSTYWQTMAHYQRPNRFITRVFNPAVAFLTRLGISVLGSRVLAVRGRASGQWRMTPVNLLMVNGARYLVAPRGETQWVRNLRVQGEGRLLL